MYTGSSTEPPIHSLLAATRSWRHRTSVATLLIRYIWCGLICVREMMFMLKQMVINFSCLHWMHMRHNMRKCILLHKLNWLVNYWRTYIYFIAAWYWHCHLMMLTMMSMMSMRSTSATFFSIHIKLLPSFSLLAIQTVYVCDCRTCWGTNLFTKAEAPV